MTRKVYKMCDDKQFNELMGDAKRVVAEPSESVKAEVAEAMQETLRKLTKDEVKELLATLLATVRENVKR